MSIPEQNATTKRKENKNGMTFQPGDKAVLFGQTMLSKVSMSGRAGKTVTLQRKLTLDEITSRPSLYGVREAWWVTIVGASDHEYYVPLGCLALTDDACDRIDQLIESETKKEKHMLVAVTMLKTPSVKAQEAGEMESILVPTTEKVSHDKNAAIALVAAENHEVISALGKEGAKLRVVVREIAI